MAVIQFSTAFTNGTLTIGTPVSQKVSGTYLTLTVPEHYIRVNIPVYPANDSVARYYTVRYAFFKNGSQLSTTTGNYNSNTVANSYVDATLPSKTVTTSTSLSSLFSSANPTEAYVPIEIKNYSGDMYLTNSAQYSIFNGSFSVSLGVINAYLDAPPTFDTSALSFNTTAPYAGATTASVTVSNTSAKYGGTITSVEFAIGEQTDTLSGDGTLSIDLNAGGTFTPTVTVTDSRGQKSKYDFAPITVNVYDKPSVSFDVERTLSTGKPDDEGTYSVINPTFTFTDVVATLSAPTVAVTDQDGITTTVTPTWYSSRAQDGTLSGSVTWGNLSTGATVYGLISGFNTQYSYQISVTPEDSQDTGTTQTQTLGGAYYTVDFLAGGHGIAFGKPSSNEGFECAMDATFEDTLTAQDMTQQEIDDFVDSIGGGGDPVADVVVEVGTDGIWNYRKWESGRYEAWAFSSTSATHYVTFAGWYGYYVDLALPSFMLTKDNLFITCPLSSGTQFCTPSGYVISSSGLRAYCVSAGSGTQTIMFNLLMIGKWK